ECLDVLNQNLSENKNDFICIIAGYGDELDKCFFSANPGLRRRFPFRFTIDGYTAEELRDIFISKLSDNKRWSLDEDLNMDIMTKFFKEHKNKFKYYGGDVENLITSCRIVHSTRLFGKHPKYRFKITEDDLCKGFEEFIKRRKDEND